MKILENDEKNVNNRFVIQHLLLDFFIYFFSSFVVYCFLKNHWCCLLTNTYWLSSRYFLPLLRLLKGTKLNHFIETNNFC
jgi:hypothetical protein